MRKSERQIRRDNDFAIIFRVRWVGVTLANRSESLPHRRYGKYQDRFSLAFSRK